MLQKGEDIAKMLVSVGYNVKDIELPEEDPLGWSENMNIDSYRIRARTELEKEEYREFFDSIGMHYLGERKWDLREMK